MIATTHSPSGQRSSFIPSYTGPLEFLAGYCVLMVVDAQNLVETARELGFRVAWNGLRRLFEEVAGETCCYAVHAAEPGDDHWQHYYEQRGWTPHAKKVCRVRKDGQYIRESNADIAVAALTGMLVAEYRPNWLIYGSGDGQLGIDTAQSIRYHYPEIAVATLSLPGSLSNRLKTHATDLIDANITLGRDCLDCSPTSNFASDSNRTFC